MITYGWTTDELVAAASRATTIVGTPIRCSELVVRTENCKIGGWTIKCILRPGHNCSARKRDGSYPPGIKLGYRNGSPRSSGALCFHAFGHFMRALFQINPHGIIKTGYARYDGLDGFEDEYPRVGMVNRGSNFEPLLFCEACECEDYDVEEF